MTSERLREYDDVSPIGLYQEHRQLYDEVLKARDNDDKEALEKANDALDKFAANKDRMAVIHIVAEQQDIYRTNAALERVAANTLKDPNFFFGGLDSTREPIKSKNRHDRAIGLAAMNAISSAFVKNTYLKTPEVIKLLVQSHTTAAEASDRYAEHAEAVWVNENSTRYIPK